MSLLEIFTAISAVATVVMTIYALWYSHQLTDEKRKALIDSIRTNSHRSEV